jgi:hypothetical protein
MIMAFLLTDKRLNTRFETNDTHILWELRQNTFYMCSKRSSVATPLISNCSKFVKLSLCCSFNRAPCHEGVLGEWKYSFTHSLISALDEGEWSASRPGRFTPGKEPLVPLNRSLGRPQSRSGRGSEEKNSHHPPPSVGFKLQYNVN